jgi:hypothetical protein
VSLDDCPALQAMSYAWGGEQPSVEVVVNDMQLKITSTVADMLHYQCSLYGSRYLWIDAVCINQMDVDERGQQVQLMRDIFGKASDVVAWLGPTGNAENPHLARLMLYFIAFWETLSSDGPRALIVERQAIRLPALDTLLDIVDRPFFERMWIIQEASVAKRCMVVLV